MINNPIGSQDMISKLHGPGIVFILSMLLLAGCTPSEALSTIEPVQAEPVPEVTNEVLSARDAALSYVQEQYGAEAPALGLAWEGVSTLPKDPPPGWSEYQFTSHDCVITIGHAVLPPEQTVYHVSMDNRATKFHWEGRVNARGQVMDSSGGEAEPVRAPDPSRALDEVLHFLGEYYADQAPSPPYDWIEEEVTSEELIGWAILQYTSDRGYGDWVVKVSYPIVAPENVIYQVIVDNETISFHWEGEVDASGKVTE